MFMRKDFPFKSGNTKVTGVALMLTPLWKDKCKINQCMIILTRNIMK